MHNPGWVDLQVNGCVGVDFSNPALTESEFLRAADYVFESGTAVFLPTLITSAPEVYRRNLPLIREAVKRHDLGERIPGVHLEGPFLSAESGAIGAHNPTWVQTPTAEAIEMLLGYAPGFVKLITLAAEVPGVVEAISLLRSRNVVLSLGHHMASATQVSVAAFAGAQALTHLGNAVPGMLPRHENPIWAGLAEERLSAMLICDGHHLPETLIRVICRVKGADHVVVTSDASPVAGFAPGHCQVFGNEAILEPNGKLYYPETGYLAASAAMLSDCMRYLEALHIFNESELKKVGRDNALALLNMQ